MRGFIFVALLAVAGAGEVRAQDAAAGEKVFGVARPATRSARPRRMLLGRPSTASSAARPAAFPAIRIRPPTRTPGSPGMRPTFREYIKDPKAKIPGTKMIYAGLKDEQKTNDLVAFLKQFDADGKKK